MIALAFTVPGDPRGKGRPRFGKGFAYTDAKTASYENLVKLCARQALGHDKPLDGPLCVTVHARFTPPQSVSRKARGAMLAGETPPAKRPDVDNLAKAILDGCNTVAWRDDAQVVSLFIRKSYAEEAGLDVVIRPYCQPRETAICALEHAA
jgi:Holliday junction resolvase RusA-like endonuclease